jgi:hypothetical protein
MVRLKPDTTNGFEPVFKTAIGPLKPDTTNGLNRFQNRYGPAKAGHYERFETGFQNRCGPAKAERCERF